MKKIMCILTSVVLAFSLAACTPTTEKNAKRSQPPAGAENQATVDGAAEKASNAEPITTTTVCIYSVKEDKSGLKQNMDAIDGTELDAQLLIDKMAELGVIEEGIKVLSFEQKKDVLTLDLSSLAKKNDAQVQTAIANTFLQNYEADSAELVLSVAGEQVGSAGIKYNRDYKTFK